MVLWFRIRRNVAAPMTMTILRHGRPRQAGRRYNNDTRIISITIVLRLMTVCL
jgi:hypothetical protein